MQVLISACAVPVSRGSSYSATNGEGVLWSRESVCQGYAELLTTLAQAAGFMAQTISGYAQGFNEAVGPRLNDDPNYAWNAVKATGKWHFIDCTWAAGYVDENGGYNKRHDEHYFTTFPREFIYDDFPTASR